MQLNIARFAEALLPAIHAVDWSGSGEGHGAEISSRFLALWLAQMLKLRIEGAAEADAVLIDRLFSDLETHVVYFALLFRSFSMLLRGEAKMQGGVLPTAGAMTPWIADRWKRLEGQVIAPPEYVDAMDPLDPRYIPRNHQSRLRWLRPKRAISIRGSRRSSWRGSSMLSSPSGRIMPTPRPSDSVPTRPSVAPDIRGGVSEKRCWAGYSRHGMAAKVGDAMKAGKAWP